MRQSKKDALPVRRDNRVPVQLPPEAVPRRRVDVVHALADQVADELAELLGDELPSAAHCLGRNKETATIFQSYVPGPRTRVETVTRKLQREISLSRSSPELNRYVDNRRYGFLVLVHNEERKTKIERVLRRRSGRSSVPLVRQALIRVDVVPELEEVALCGQA